MKTALTSLLQLGVALCIKVNSATKPPSGKVVNY